MSFFSKAANFLAEKCVFNFVGDGETHCMDSCFVGSWEGFSDILVSAAINQDAFVFNICHSF